MKKFIILTAICCLTGHVHAGFLPSSLYIKRLFQSCTKNCQNNPKICQGGPALDWCAKNCTHKKGMTDTGGREKWNWTQIWIKNCQKRVDIDKNTSGFISWKNFLDNVVCQDLPQPMLNAFNAFNAGKAIPPSCADLHPNGRPPVPPRTGKYAKAVESSPNGRPPVPPRTGKYAKAVESSPNGRPPVPPRTGKYAKSPTIENMPPYGEQTYSAQNPPPLPAR